MTTDGDVTAGLLALGDEAFVSLTTFRRSGVGVATPVWIARDGDALVVTTPARSGKVKRLRHTDRVELRPCSRTGTVPDDAVAVRARATVVAGPTATRRLTTLFRAKYGFEYRVMTTIERLTSRGRRERVMLRIEPSGA